MSVFSRSKQAEGWGCVCVCLCVCTKVIPIPSVCSLIQRQSFEQSACHISHFTSKSLYSWQLLHLSIVPLRHKYCKQIYDSLFMSPHTVNIFLYSLQSLHHSCSFLISPWIYTCICLSAFPVNPLLTNFPFLQVVYWFSEGLMELYP